MKTERIFSSRNDARVQKFSFWLERSIMKTFPVLCFSSVIEETVYITGSDETNFCDTDKIQRDERCMGREKEKKTGSRNKRCFSFFFFFYSLASQSHRRPNFSNGIDFRTFSSIQMPLPFTYGTRLAKYACSNHESPQFQSPSSSPAFRQFSFSSNVSDIIRFFARKIHLSDVSFPSSTFDRRPRLISRLKNGQRKTSRTSKTKDTQVAHRIGIIKTGKREEGVCFMV